MKLGVPWTSKGRKGERPPPYGDADTASVHDRLDDLTRQLERLSRITAGKVRPPGSAAHGAPTRQAPPPPDDDDSYDRPEPDYPERRPEPDHPERRPEPYKSEDRIVSRDVSRYAGDRTLNRHPLQPVYSNSGLDRTLAEIAARQRALDGEPRMDVPRPMVPPSQNLSGLEEQLRKITTQIESLRRPCPVEDAVPALREELSEISRTMAEAVPRRAIEAIEAEVRGLVERLDQSRQAGGDAAALANLEGGLAEVRDALRSLKPAESLVGFQNAIQGLSRKIDAIVATQNDPVVLQQLESAITGLRGIVAHVASDDTLARLTEEVRGIAVRLERTAGAAPSPDSLTNLERQINVIAEAIESGSKGRELPAKMETMLRGLADKVETLQVSRGDTIALGQLEDRIAKLVEKIDASGSRFNQLEAIERGLADVLVHLEEQRTRGGSALRTTAGDPNVEALKRDMDAVNGTLNRIVERLTTIETGIRGASRPGPAMPQAAILPAAPAPAQPATVAPSGKAAPKPAAAPAASPPPPPPAAAAPPPPAPAPAQAKPDQPDQPPTTPAKPTLVAVKAPVPPPSPTASTSPAQPVAPPSERLAAAAQAQRPTGQRSVAPIDPNLPPDHPIEPGAAHVRTTQSAADRIAASEAALGPAKPAGETSPNSKTNFIAAARRAAQTASKQPADSEDKDATTATGDGRSLRQRLAGRMRSMLVGTSVVILAVAAAHVAMTLIEPYTADVPEAKQVAQAPAIKPPDTKLPSKSNDRVPSVPMFTGSSSQPDPTKSVAALADKTPMAGRSIWDSANPAAQSQAMAQPDVTGSIPPKAAVPLPPSRPASESATAPKSHLATAAEAGDPAAAYELAVRYIEGRTVDRNYQNAAQWLTRASKHGLAPAQFRLGSLYEKGLGVKKDLAEARRLYSAAAEKGNAKAMHNLAVLYAEGVEGKPNYKTAAEWFRKAANRGIADSQYNLGVLYARGVGVEQNLAESYKWFALAAQQGDKDSARKRDDIMGKLDAESQMAARLAVKTWTMEPQPEEATMVKTPPGGWDQESPTHQAPPASVRRRPRTGAPLKIGPS